MNYSVSSTSPENQQTACVIVAVYENNKLSPSATAIDKASNGFISSILKNGDIKGQPGQTLMLYDVPNIKAKRVLLVGAGKAKSTTNKQYQKILDGITNTIANLGAADSTLYLTELNLKDKDAGWHIYQAILNIEKSQYEFTEFKSATPKKAKALKKITFGTPEIRSTKTLNKIIKQAKATAHGVSLTKTLGNLPGNVCTPNYLAKQAQNLQKTYKSIKLTVLDEKDMKKLGMGSFLSVSKGSTEPGKLIVMEYYNGKKGKKPAVLVGKGITFDTGGISLKPGAAMDEMKYDMCGAASVFGTLAACAEMELPVNLICVVAAAENMPNGNASKPGDIVTSMSGQTIEILNTDAEGRLVLCDALTYVEKFNPAVVIDMATLTGSCIVALGRIPSGMFSNNSKLANDLIEAGDVSNDRIWQLPLWDDYQDLLKSNFADMANIGGRDAGTITAACFLSRFTKKYHWAHIDIAGTAWISGPKKGATGRPVPLLVQYLISKHADKSA